KMEIPELKAELGKKKRQNVDLMKLPDRKRKELEFHNQNRDTALTAQLPKDTYELLHGNRKFYSTVGLSRTYIDQWLAGHVPGKVFLDYACGNGLNAIKAAKMGAALAIGLDISDVSVANAVENAKEAGVAENTAFVQGDCENTGLPDNSIDVII